MLMTVASIEDSKRRFRQLYVENASTTYMMTSYEAPTINHIVAQTAPSVEALRAQGEAVMQSPQMYDGAITFPTTRIIETFNNSRSLASTDTVGVLNTINMTIPLKPMPAEFESLGHCAAPLPAADAQGLETQPLRPMPSCR